MVYVNGPDSYRSIVPQDAHVLSDDISSETFPLVNGMYRREVVQDEADKFRVQIEAQDGLATVQGMQYWAELAWKTPHGTYRSVERFQEKADEEYVEVKQAYDAYLQGKTSAADLAAELGDLNFCILVGLSNAGGSLDAGLKNVLYRYVMGINHVDQHGRFVKPRWHDVVGRVATKYELINMTDIDAVFAAGFEPTFSSVMNVDLDEDDYDMSAGSYVHMLGGDVIAFYGMSDQLYNYGEDTNEAGNRVFMMPEMQRTYAAQMGEVAAGIFLRLGFIAKTAAKLSMADVLKLNVAKIDYRLVHNQIDKTDNPRHKF